MADTHGNPDFGAVLRAGVAAQRLVPGAVAVGGTAAALYARHRLSLDTDHLVDDLRSRFDEVRERVEQSLSWKTARVQPPVLILGSIDGVQVGYRQSRRRDAIATTTFDTMAGKLVVPTLDELIGMKAYLAYSRNATRDFVDFAALTQLAGEEIAHSALLKSDARYGHLQTQSVGLQIAKSLVDAMPFDLTSVDLTRYKSLDEEWQEWTRIAESARRHGEWLGKALSLKRPGGP